MADATQPWTWRHDDGTASNDWSTFSRKLAWIAGYLGLALDSLGEVGGEPLLRLQTPGDRPGLPRLLVASGFHGEEPAGPWGILAWLDTRPREALAAVALTILPVVNVAGFRAGRRLNADGDNPNRGYLPGHEPLSAEGCLLLHHADALAAAGRDGFLACHEDVDAAEAYIYGLERSEQPGEFSRALARANAAWFPLQPDGLLYDCPIRDGIIFNHPDTSFEAWMMSRGAARAACVETPGQQPFMRRIAAQRAMIEAFTGFVVPAPG